MKKISLTVMCLGIILFLIGLFIKIPGTDLTTYHLLEGSKNYSVIEEYVGGDAYNYIIGASLVGGKIAGIYSMKANFISIGLLIFSIGLVFNHHTKKKEEIEKQLSNINSKIENLNNSVIDKTAQSFFTKDESTNQDTDSPTQETDESSVEQ